MARRKSEATVAVDANKNKSEANQNHHESSPPPFPRKTRSKRQEELNSTASESPQNRNDTPKTKQQKSSAKKEPVSPSLSSSKVAASQARNGVQSKSPKNSFKFGNDECLLLYQAMKSPEEFIAAFEKEDREKFIRGALKANNGTLECMLCKKKMSSSCGIVLHLKANTCKAEDLSTSKRRRAVKAVLDSKPHLAAETDSVVLDSTAFSPTTQKRLPPLDGRAGRPSSSRAGLEIKSLDDLKKEPSLWFRMQDNDRKKLLQKFYGPGPYKCFAIRAPGQAECIDANSIDESLAHLIDCIQLMYFTFKGARINEFRTLDKKLKARYIREAMIDKNSLECLECDRTFSHQYGLLYHIDRCNVEADKVPWKCYRCGFQTIGANREEHLANCYALDNIEATVVVREELDVVHPVMGTLTDVNLRSGKAVPRGGDPLMLNGVDASRPASEIINELVQKELGSQLPFSIIKSECGRKRRSKVSMTSGIIPPESSRCRVQDNGVIRFRFRKAEITTNAADLSGWDEYLNTVKESNRVWEENMNQLPLCEPIKRISKQNWPKSIQISSHLLDREKRSPMFCLQKENKIHHGEGSFPIHSQSLKSMESLLLTVDEELKEWISMAYTGGPINCVKFAPNPMSNGEEVLAVSTFGNEEDLINDDWKTASSPVQFWRVKHDQSGNSSEMSIWFVLETRFGQVLDLCWLDRPRQADDSTLIGHLSAATAQGVVLIYRIDSTCIPSTSKGASEAPVVHVEPSLILRQPHYYAGGPFLKVKTEQVEVTQEPVSPSKDNEFSPPLTRIDWSNHDSAQYLAAVNAGGFVVFWDLLKADDGAPKVIRDASWSSPASDLSFSKSNELAIAFREKLVKIYDVRTWEVILEENTIRTAGSRVYSENRISSGVFTYQSEYFMTTNVGATGLAFLTTDDRPESLGYFVVPLGNRHDLQCWDVSLSSMNAVAASCGVDGYLFLSANGRVIPTECKRDFGFSILRPSLLLTRNRISNKTEDDAEGKPILHEGFMSHQEICENMFLGIATAPVKEMRKMEYASLDNRIDSLNSVSTNKYGSPVVVCGGQAGLLFCRPCSIDHGAPVELNDLYNRIMPSNLANLTKNKGTKSDKSDSVKQSKKKRRRIQSTDEETTETTAESNS